MGEQPNEASLRDVAAYLGVEIAQADVDAFADLKELVEDGKARLGLPCGFFGLYMQAARDLGRGASLDEAMAPIEAYARSLTPGAHLTLVVDNPKDE